MKEITLAFAGQPNCGKTTIFNEVTGSRQHVGNWPGVTVEYKEGSVTKGDITYKIIDLPGLYSLSAYSYEEIVSRDFLIKEKVDIIVNIVDSSILERSLFFTTQLMEIGLPMMIVFNMEDVLKEKNIEVDFEAISKALNVPYITTQGSKTKSFDKFFDIVNEIYDHKEFFIPRSISYSNELETEIKDTLNIIKVKNPFYFYKNQDEHDPKHLLEHHEHDIPTEPFIINKAYNPIRLRWYVVRAFEGDSDAIEVLQKSITFPQNIATLTEIKRGHMAEVYGLSLSDVFVDDRYGYVGGITGEFINYSKAGSKKDKTEKIDNILLNKWLGLPLFAVIMFITFSVAFTLGDYVAGFLEEWIGIFGNILKTQIENPMLRDFVCDGIISGVGSVLVFIPTIAFMFMMISILEDSGYMSRAAFLADKAMHSMGLHGKSFVSMLLGFGCNVPAIMAARTLDSRADKIVTIMLNPLMSCSARLPIYVFFTSIFFDVQYRAMVIISIYLAGIILAIIVGKILRSKLFDTKESPFVMELPSYRMPTFKGTFIHSWERTKEFLIRAGTIITLVCIIIWAITVFPSQENSIAVILGKFIEPIMKPIGLDWMAAVACLFGVGAKEVVVSAINILASSGGGDVASVMREAYTPLQSYVFMLFCLIYCPCAATIISMKKEIGELKYFLIGVLYPIVLAWVICFVVYQIGRLF
ncbi:MAG: ferrous iron transport protein B [Abditibacteriota bacterium]|nr:ferrous iron transport protein B [Abditibacteriota bacterium]